MHNFLIPFLTIASLHFLVVIAPGPDFALVTKNALLYPRRAAIYTVVGITLGLSVHMSYCVFGLVWIEQRADMLFSVIKYLGAAYLIYIGIKSLIRKVDSTGEAASNMPVISEFKAMSQGFLCNLLNPKVGLFFIGLFTLVIKPDTPMMYQISYAAWMLLVTFIWFGLVACFITHPFMRQRLFRLQPLIVKLLGICLVAAGVLVLLI